MKGFENLKAHLESFEKNRKAVREIFPTAIELYYHEETGGGFKDPIMYHTNDRKRTDGTSYFANRKISKVPYFPLGSMNPHTSGIDITFENSEEQYRASFLLREYKVSIDGGPLILIKNSTDIYDDMLIQGIPFGDADWIEWVDNRVNGQSKKSEGGRMASPSVSTPTPSVLLIGSSESFNRRHYESIRIQAPLLHPSFRG